MINYGEILYCLIIVEHIEFHSNNLLTYLLLPTYSIFNFRMICVTIYDVLHLQQFFLQIQYMLGIRISKTIRVIKPAKRGPLALKELLRSLFSVCDSNLAVFKSWLQWDQLQHKASAGPFFPLKLSLKVDSFCFNNSSALHQSLVTKALWTAMPFMVQMRHFLSINFESFFKRLFFYLNSINAVYY